MLALWPDPEISQLPVTLLLTTPTARTKAPVLSYYYNVCEQVGVNMCKEDVVA
jgi:hypothetical protein